MAGNSTVNITYKVEGDSKGFKTLSVDAEGLKKLINSTATEAEQLKKSLINWSQVTQSISAVSNVVSDLSSAMSDLSGRMQDTQRQNVLVTQLTGKTGDAMLELRNSVRAVSDHFGLDFYETLRSANNLANAFGITVDDAMMLMRDGLVSGANANGEFIDTVREYPRYFKEAGLSAEEFIAISTNAAKQGIYSDKGVDAIKEGNLRIREMTTATAEALEAIGISSEQVQRDLQSGMTTTFEVMQQVAARLKELPASSAEVGAALADIFGGPGEDAGLEYIKSLDGVVLSMERVKEVTGETAAQQERQIGIQENVRNSLSGLIDMSGLYTDIKPYVDLTAQLGLTAVGVTSLAKSVKSLIPLKILLGAKTRIVSTAMKAATAISGTYKAALNALTAATGSARAATIALYATLTMGLSVAIAAVISLIQKLTERKREEREATEALSDADDSYAQTLVDAKSRMSVLIAELRSFNGSRDEEKAKVDELNSVYGDTFGTYQTVRDWYDVLIAGGLDKG